MFMYLEKRKKNGYAVTHVRRIHVFKNEIIYIYLISLSIIHSFDLSISNETEPHNACLCVSIDAHKIQMRIPKIRRLGNSVISHEIIM